MSSDFDWRAEDDHRWDEYASPEQGDGNKPPRGRPPTLLIIFGVLVVVAAVGLLTYRQLRRYVDNTAASVEEDVLSSHALVKLAAVEDDLELLAPLLSGRDPSWTQAQLTLLDMNLLIDRQPFELTWKPQETADEISIELSPDLQSAEVEYTETYGYGLDGEEGEIELVQTAVYRLSETRWLLSPPAKDFWGNWISSQGRYIILTYPERDEELGGRLAADIEATLANACSNLDLDCENAPPLDVLLATDPEAMMEAGNANHFADNGEPFILPAPTLVGKPANNSGYRVLHRAYSTMLVSRLLARQTGWDCCEQSLFFNALLDVQLQQLSLQSWPLQPNDYRAALRMPVELAVIRSFWEDGLSLTEAQERPDYWMLHLFIEYLLTGQEDYTVVDLQRFLARTDSFNTWLTDAGVTGSLNVVEQDWRDFSFERVAENQEQPPVAWPEEDVALICNDGQSGAANVYRYDPMEGKWSVALGDRDFVVMSGLPQNEGLILTEQYLDVDQLRTTLWREGEEVTVMSGNGFLFSSDISDPTDRYLILNLFQQGSLNDGSFESSIFLLELANCLAGDCPLIPITSRPVWSPDGSQTLWVVTEGENPLAGEDRIYLGDAVMDSAENVAAGTWPFWLDNERFAFLPELGAEAVMMGDINGGASEQLVELADLAALLPDFGTDDLLLNDARTDPFAPDLIYLIVANRLENTDYIFTYDWRSGEKKLVVTIEDSYGGLAHHSFSPNHRWLMFRTIATSAGPGRSYQEVFVYDTESEATQRYNLVDEIIVPNKGWSNDGRWLVFVGRGFLMFSAPEAGFDYIVPHGFRDCTAVSWIKKPG